MKLSLPDEVASSQDLKAVIADVRRYSKWASQNSIKQRVSSSKADSQPEISAAAVNFINQWLVENGKQAKTLDPLIEMLEDFAGSVPHATVTLAAPAPRKLKQEIVAWFRKNVQPDILVDFKFNATMLGGMVVHYGSQVYDWSFKKSILANRAKFPEVLRNVR